MTWALAALTIASWVTGCRPKSPISRPPTSIESLCLAGGPVERVFKLPGVDTVHADRLFKGQDLHVDVDAAERVALAATRELAGPPLDEDQARLMVTQTGGGVIVWWRDRAITLHFASADPKVRSQKQDVFAIAIPEPVRDEARVLYVLARPAGSADTPSWKAVDTADDERVCM